MSDATHIHTDGIIVDADEHFIIDTLTRAISSESNRKLTLMQYDHNSERYSFDINRIIDGHDLMDCDRVQIHYVNIASNKQKHPGLYRVEDLHVNPSDENKLTFTWLVSGNATMYHGALGFLVSFECTKNDEILYRWSSNAFNSIGITQGMDNDNTIYELYNDELLAWQNYMQTEYIPDLVDECYVEREFATAEEVARVFDISNPDGTTPVVITPFEEVTEYVDNAIETAMSGGSSDGAKLYQHFVRLSASNPKGDSPIAVILNRSAEVFTISTLASYLYNNGFTGKSSMTYPVSTRVASPAFSSETSAMAILGVLSDDGSTVYIKTTVIAAYTNDDGTIGTTAGGSSYTYDVRSITDTVSEV